MNVLLFTHISDIDGLNNIALAQQAFNEINYILCEANEIDQKVINNWNKLSSYDYIFVTDLCPNKDTLDLINNSELKCKFKVFDHHKSALDQLSNDFDFVTVKIENDKGLCCGTSLFYEYLIKNKFLIATKSLENMVELTRKYDTWEWKKENNLEARDLTWLFYALGIEKYLKTISKKVVENNFTITKKDYDTINKWRKKLDLKIKQAVDNILYTQVFGYKVGIIKTIYEYRNDISDYIKDNNYDIDFLAIVFSDKNSISYRSIKANVDVNEIAKNYGGKGHVKAASSPISEEEKENIIKYFTKQT